MTIALSKRNLFALGAAIIILMAIGYSSCQNIAAYEDIRVRNRHARAVIKDIETLLAAVADAEISQREFLLTGKEVYLEPYAAATDKVSRGLADVVRHFDREARDQDLGRQLRERVGIKLAELDQAVAARRKKGLRGGMEIVFGEADRVNMEAFRAILNARLDEEIATIKANSERAEAASGDTITRVIAGSLFAIAFVLVAGFQVNRELRERRQIEADLRRNDALLGKEKRRLSGIISTQNDIAMAGLAPARIMDVIVARTMDLTAATGAAVEIAEGEDLVYRAGSGAAADKVGFRVRKAGSLSGQCVAEAKILHCEDAESDARVDRAACRAIGVRSMVVVPLLHDGEAIGALKAFSDRPHAFHDSDVDTLRLIAGMFGSSMAHAYEYEAKRKAEEAAREASRLKSNFLATMSHEIRTPINGVIGMAHLLGETPLDARQAEGLGDIKRSAESLLAIVNDILDLSKIEAGRLEVEMVDFDLDQVISDVGKTMSFAARQKGLGFTVQNPGDWHHFYVGDPGRIRQVLINLLGNAIKFTDEGNVQFRVRMAGDEDGAASFLFEIEDSGIGIPDEALGRLFQPFTQADASTTRRFGGTGLGLSISKHLVELMGGTIGATSRAGAGSTFWFRIPMRKGGARPVTAASGKERLRISAHKGKRILVVEDNVINQKVAVGFVASIGHHATIAGNGVEALAKLRASPFDLILMDCQMPGMDGYETTQAIRASHAAAWRGIPIIAMTANAVKGDRERCLDAGMNDYLAKPLRPGELAIMLDKWFSKAAADETPPRVDATSESDATAAMPVLDHEILDGLGTLNPAGGFAAFLEDLFHVFTGTVPDGIADMDAALARGDVKAMASRAHALKSAGGNLGAARFAAVCQALENQRDGGQAPAAEALLRQLRSEYDSFTRAMRAFITDLTKHEAA